MTGVVSVIVFTLEYLARLWTAVEMPFLARMSPTEARLTLAKKGGLIIDLGVRGFLPDSLNGLPRGTDASTLVGQNLEVKVIEAARNESRADGRVSDRLVVDRKSFVAKERARMKAETLAKLAPGQLHTGRVVALTNFGAFIDIGGVEGLIHVSELSHQQVAHPSDVVKVGQEIQAVVIDVERGKNKIALSRKRALPDPWAKIGEKYREGELVYGTITGIAAFGVFLRVEPEDGSEGVEGLIHISELSKFRVEQASDVVAVGEGVWAMVLGIDPGKRRLSLSMRRALSE